MKDDLPQHLSASDPDHPSSTVIHHPEEDQTILARWLFGAMQKGPKFWTLVGGVVAALVVLVVLASGLLRGESTSTEAWTKLFQASTGEQQEEVAQLYPETRAAHWANLAAAGSIYSRGFDQLTTSRDAALPLLKRAHKLYGEVRKASLETDPDLARLAAFGMARALEAIGDLPGAIEQYRSVAKTWPDSAEGERAERLASTLEDPKNVELYKWLAAYKPPEMTLDPMGGGEFNIPSFPPMPPGSSGFGSGLGSGSSGLGSPSIGIPPLGEGILDIPPPPSNPPTEAPATATEPVVIPAPAPATIPTPSTEGVPSGTQMPDDPFAPPSPTPTTPSGSQLPSDPFAPEDPSPGNEALRD